MCCLVTIVPTPSRLFDSGAADFSRRESVIASSVNSWNPKTFIGFLLIGWSRGFFSSSFRALILSPSKLIFQLDYSIQPEPVSGVMPASPYMSPKFFSAASCALSTTDRVCLPRCEPDISDSYVLDIIRRRRPGGK